MRCKAICLICSAFSLAFSSAQALEICGTLQQGGFVKVSDENLQKIEINGKTILADATGTLPLAFGRDAKIKQDIKVFYTDGIVETKTLQLASGKWDVQKINGVDNRKVNPQKNDLAEINKELNAVKNALQQSYDLSAWQQNMIIPVEGKTSGYFGNQRIFNGVAKNPHSGWDIASSEGTEVKAMADGIVTLSDGPFFYCGNMVILNHGENISTIYAHLQKLSVKNGESVNQGQIIGYVGKTGRATGAHLHLGAVWNGVRFDARNLLNLNKCIKL